jgi:hypothetical protein
MLDSFSERERNQRLLGASLDRDAAAYRLALWLKT